MFTLSKYPRNIVAGAIIAISTCAALNTFASPVFEIDPTSNGFSSIGSAFTADSIHGGSSTRSINVGGTNYASTGYIAFTGFTNSGSPVGAGTTGLTVDYGLYGLFTQTFSCPTLLSSGVTCAVTGITFSLYGDPGFLNTYNSASILNNPIVTDVGGNDVLLGKASLVVGGLAGLNALGGAFENVNTDFALTSAGSNYFIDPVPFYNLAFSEFNNTSAGIQCNTPGCVNSTAVAINNQTGSIDFNKVPEPAMPSLFGLGLAGLAFVRKYSIKG